MHYTTKKAQREKSMHINVTRCVWGGGGGGGRATEEKRGGRERERERERERGRGGGRRQTDREYGEREI